VVHSRVWHPATLLPDGRVLIAGATGADAELYEPRTRTFAPTGSMLTSQQIQSATLLANGTVLVAGDKDAELFDPARGTFRRAGPYAKAPYSYIATLLVDGR